MTNSIQIQPNLRVLQIHKRLPGIAPEKLMTLSDSQQQLVLEELSKKDSLLLVDRIPITSLLEQITSWPSTEIEALPTDLFSKALWNSRSLNQAPEGVSPHSIPLILEKLKTEGVDSEKRLEALSKLRGFGTTLPAPLLEKLGQLDMARFAVIKLIPGFSCSRLSEKHLILDLLIRPPSTPKAEQFPIYNFILKIRALESFYKKTELFLELTKFSKNSFDRLFKLLSTRKGIDNILSFLENMHIRNGYKIPLTRLAEIDPLLLKPITVDAEYFKLPILFNAD